MTHIADLNNDCYFARGPRLRAIGWLEGDKEFEVGPVNRDLVALLREHVKNRFVIIDFMGGQTCTLCRGSSGPYGSGELIIPASEVCYVAPVLVVHYVEIHRYRPPTEFVAAVEACPPQRSPAYMSLVAPFLKELEPHRGKK